VRILEFAWFLEGAEIPDPGVAALCSSSAQVTVVIGASASCSFGLSGLFGLSGFSLDEIKQIHNTNQINAR
jgi:hypothetical protein